MAAAGDPTSTGREVLRLAVPAFGALVAQPLFTLIDAAIVATLGTTTLAGLGAGAQVFTTITGLAVFLAYGTTSAVARRVGAGQPGRGITDGVEGIALGAALGAGAAVAVWWTAPWLLDLIGTSEASTAAGLAYLRTVCLGLPFALAAMAAIGVLRGLQDTVATLWITVMAVVANLGLSAFLVLVAGWGIVGSAWATVAAEAIAAGLLLTTLLVRARRLGASIRPSGTGMRRAARGSIPLFWRTLALRAVLVIAVVIAARLGDDELAAHYVAFTIWSLLALAMDALAIAGQALLGRQLGAGHAERARSVTGQLLRWGVMLGMVLGMLVLLVHSPVARLFGADPSVHALIASTLLVVAAQQPLAAVVFVLDGVLLGAGDGPFLAAVSVLALATFVPLAWWVARAPGDLTDLWLALTAFLAVRAAALAWRVGGSGWLVTGATR